MEKKLYISCTCHCGDALVAEAPDLKNVYINFSSYMHHAAQGRFFRGLIDDLRTIWNHGFLMEILVRREDMEALRSLLLDAEYDEEEFENEGRIRFVYDRDGFGYMILLYSRQSFFRIMIGKRYRCYSYCVGRKERTRLLKQIGRALKAGEAD